MFNLIILENDNWFWTGFEDFFKTISTNYYIFNPSVRDTFFTEKTKAWFVMLLCQNSVTDVALQTAFESKVFSDRAEDIDDAPNQLEFYLPLLRQVLHFREEFEMPILTFHLIYNGVEDFMTAVNTGELGESAKDSLTLLLRQQDNLIIKLYNQEFKLINTIKASSK